MSDNTVVSSRRKFLSLAGAAALTPLVAACGGGSGGGSSGGTSVAAAANVTPTVGLAANSSSSSSSSDSSSASSSASSSTNAGPAATTSATLSALAWTKATGPALNTAGLVQTFDSTFSSSDDLRKITVNGAGGPWYAPIHADYGSAHFASPLDAVSPFAIDNGRLRIRCEQVNGAWQSGHMQTCDLAGSGFSQRRGYFELRAKMPANGTLGAWPAFWMYSKSVYTDTTKLRAELDIIEYYPGNDPRGQHSALHLRPGLTPQAGDVVTSDWTTSCYSGLDALADGDWHTHGVEITDSWIIVYFDRVEIKRIPLLAEFDVPMFMMVSLALLPDEAAQATGPIDLYVDYVRAWQRT
ncbi:glycoside hydrolase family 16 protein [Asticcacaulis solisilvae]|uniref:glycoside hydrolase family 16 protein n=1 Tax=Asticcacaulis solisilvae TaxID=1217274 RepID=UPI003FD8B143